MVDPLPSLVSLKESYRKLNKIRKNHIKLSFIIIVVSIGLIFYFSPKKFVYAENLEKEVSMDSEIIDPLHKIGKGLKNEQRNNFSKNGVLPIKEEISENPKFEEMLDGFPMEKMIPALNKRDSKVSSYLIAIAKKESDWGKFSPKKSGRDCFNYWGYKGGHYPTASGYSCFDSPEQAIEIVGDRIESLLAKKIDTPAKLVVWKCGSSCAGHSPRDVQKWIQDVAKYFNLLNDA